MSTAISIIIPCYNIAAHLPKCVDALLAQTHTDFELLLMDDGSTDATLDVCKRYEAQDPRVKAYTHPNKGVSYTRNRGIERAKNDWIVFIDGDDYVKPDYIEVLANNCEQNVWTLCGMINVRQGIEKENENYKQLLDHFPNRRIEKSDFIDLLKFYSYSSPCARIYSRSIIIQNKIVFPENVSYQEDLLFNIEYSKHIDAVKLVDYFGYYYIEHPTSSTGRYHVHFDHVDSLFSSLQDIMQSKYNDEIFFKKFIFDTILKKISNDFHHDSRLSKKRKLQNIKTVIESLSFNYIKNYIIKSPINILYKFVLLSKNKYLIYYFFNIAIS